jgi:D-3-phosphoglycerate dehydrogenase
VYQIAVGDLFIRAAWMAHALTETFGGEVCSVEWGSKDKSEMRASIQRLEKGGPEALPWPDELAEEIAEAELLMVHLAPVPAALIRRAKRLKLIASTRGGLENIDLSAATAHGVGVISNPAHNANAVAELTIGLMIAETRNVVRAHSALRHGEWREQYPLSGSIPELRGSPIGLIGFGAIGRRVAHVLRAFGAEVLVSDPYVSPEHIERRGCRSRSLEELLRVSRIVSVHARLPADAPPLLGPAEIDCMRPDAYLVNTARAGAVDMPALRSALARGRIAGAALDVFDVEPLPADDPLRHLDQVTLTNHRGSDTYNSYADSPRMVAEQARRFFAGERPDFLANPELFPHLREVEP